MFEQKELSTTPQLNYNIQLQWGLSSRMVWVALHCYFLIATVCRGFNPINAWGKKCASLPAGSLTGHTHTLHCTLESLNNCTLKLSLALFSPHFLSLLHTHTHMARGKPDLQELPLRSMRVLV